MPAGAAAGSEPYAATVSATVSVPADPASASSPVVEGEGKGGMAEAVAASHRHIASENSNGPVGTAGQVTALDPAADAALPANTLVNAFNPINNPKKATRELAGTAAPHMEPNSTPGPFRASDIPNLTLGPFRASDIPNSDSLGTVLDFAAAAAANSASTADPLFAHDNRENQNPAPTVQPASQLITRTPVQPTALPTAVAAAEPSAVAADAIELATHDNPPASPADTVFAHDTQNPVDNAAGPVGASRQAGGVPGALSDRVPPRPVAAPSELAARNGHLETYLLPTDAEGFAHDSSEILARDDGEIFVREEMGGRGVRGIPPARAGRSALESLAAAEITSDPAATAAFVLAPVSGSVADVLRALADARARKLRTITWRR
ncbi:hypothetical protein T492DRAFT_425154 [Pavlovales sp. CCMP2436]|nr:hypothetical protein T492DRAFT_425154 [Pavlovales sp. CCMP2436]|mmetsp:Transcript_39797/g.98369  ORF Transcript_39797/g.98369 Transcript_39797/m.98369 type:complete len:380 (+) Transcript_39797:349-1488(+)